MILDFNKAEKYLKKAEKDIREPDAEDAMFHIRRSLESMVEIINKSLGFKYDGLYRDDFLLKAISDLSDSKIISQNQASAMHRIRAASNRGVHNDINEEVGGLFYAKDTYAAAEELLGALKNIGWTPVSQKDMYVNKAKKTNGKSHTLPPFVSKV